MKYLEVTRTGGVEHVTLNRPDVRNAFNDELIAELTAWAERAAADGALRAIVLAGRGPSFCAGADLQWMMKMAGFTREENLRDAAAAARMFEALDTLPVPVIARVHGAAMGGGVGLVAIADIAIAEETATFGLTEVRLGLIPAVIAPYVLAKIGQSAARELFLTGRRFSAAHARAIGLIHEVVPAAAMDEAVQRSAADILASGPEAVAAAKALIRRIAGHPPSEVMSITSEAIAERRASEEAQERMRGFGGKKGR